MKSEAGIAEPERPMPKTDSLGPKLAGERKGIAGPELERPSTGFAAPCKPQPTAKKEDPGQAWPRSGADGAMCEEPKAGSGKSGRAELRGGICGPKVATSNTGICVA